ncbi:hypothetical protein ES706_04490 [subsurface metagenome]
MSLQNPYTQSIHPGSISKIQNDSNFLEFMGYFQRDSDLYIKSCSKFSDLLVQFYQIRNELFKRALQDAYLKRIEFHSRMMDYKVDSIGQYIEGLWQKYVQRTEEIYDLALEELGKTISLPPTPEELEKLTEEEKTIVGKAQREIEIIYIHFIVGVVAFVDLMFFAFESACKVFCSFGCYAHSIKYARGEIFSHSDVWKTLKRLGRVEEKQNINCLICSIEKTCHFTINFEALANVYCYAIQIRMLSDYDEFFYTYKRTWENIQPYFQKLNDIINTIRKVKISWLGR